MTTHGLRNHPFYDCWALMMKRCNRTWHRAYADYGGRGITVCEEWYDPKVFIDWLKANNYGDGLQIDRRNNNAGYSPENCRIVTSKENNRNRRSNVRYSVYGEMLLPIEVEERFGVKESTFAARVKIQGRSPEDALITRKRLVPCNHEIDGVKMSSADICGKFGVSRSNFNYRLRVGWNVERAAKTPVGG